MFRRGEEIDMMRRRRIRRRIRRLRVRYVVNTREGMMDEVCGCITVDADEEKW